MADHTCHQHPPGSPNCYRNHSCRCDHCRASAARYDKQLGWRRQRTGTTRTPAHLLALHVDRLLAAGMSRSQIADAANVSQSTLRNIRGGRITGVSERVARALLAVQPPAEPTPDGWIDATGTIRRLQALNAIGWTNRDIATRLGHHHTWPERIKRYQIVHSTTAIAVRSIYNELSHTTPPHTPHRQGTRSRAQKRGWIPPTGWVDIDDPDEQPSRYTAKTRVAPDDLAWMVETGETLLGVQARTGLTIDAIEASLRRHGHSNLWRRLTRREAA